ncbi:MAG: ferrous iron transport protein B [Planctomycetia bacterium]|nr:ferrous iron transport protein B [Planctomycetia bacterium]
MAISTVPATTVVALIGNPNTGKSTLFNALAGMRQRVGNYPGVTVEKRVGHMTVGGRRFALVDLPGTYSLAPRSPDEMVAVDVLLGRQPGEEMPHAVLCIVDASNLERNLYLVNQVRELGLPVVVALNMMDVADGRGLSIDAERLSRQLGAPVVPLVAHKRKGVEELRRILASLDAQPSSTPAGDSPFPAAFQNELARLHDALQTRIDESPPSADGRWPRFLVERLLLDTGYLEGSLLAGDDPLRAELRSARSRLKSAGCPVPSVEAVARYGWVAKALDGVVTRRKQRPATRSDRLDRVLTHKIWGSLLFALLMAAIFSLMFFVAQWPMGWIESAVEYAKWLIAGDETKAGLLATGPLQSLVVDGVISGVGGVIIFLPQILILFFFIGIMEDCGYMARAAFLMDKLMSKVGLSGKSFIPLLSSFACAVPGIMAARVIENRRDRLATVLVAPLMSCSARLPVYTILIAAFIPTTTLLGPFLPGLVMFSMYVLGMAVAVVVAFVLKRTILRGDTPPFVMELPSYKFPSTRNVLYRMFDRGLAFVRRAGTLIVAVTIVIWALGYYPRDAQNVEDPYRAEMAAIDTALRSRPASPERDGLSDRKAEIANEIEERYLEQSLLGRTGKWVEPAVRPLGWDWRIGCAAIASFPAREVVMSTLGVIYNLGSDVDPDADADRLTDRLKAARWDDTGEPVYNVPVALSIMVFFALCAQCASTLVTLKRETNSWRWPVFAFTYMTILAYLGALATYQVGRLFLS